jgi:alkylation response protein AidB-like acyl-CoA dehydrogenase
VTRLADADLVSAEIDGLLARFPQSPTWPKKAFLNAQYDAGLAWVHFDRAYGGLGLERQFQEMVKRRLAEAGAPVTTATYIAVNQVSATLHAIGTDDQKRRFLKSIFTGEDSWCQLFSEPGAGSDLAGIATAAVHDDRAWMVNGQKVWSSGAREAKYALLLARTDPYAPKHSGLTMFIMDMRSVGVEVRPLRQADGGARFNEVFLSDVEVDDQLRLGEVGDGWRVGMLVLGTERAATSDFFVRPIEELLSLARERHEAVSPALRDEVVRRWIEARVAGWTQHRQDSEPQRGRSDVLAAIAKVVASEHAQRLSETLAAVMGPAAQVGLDYEAVYAKDMRDEGPASFRSMSPQQFIVRARAMSIEGGTNEILRNIIGERVLGLPQEPRIDKDPPWNQVPR